jgi:hypothetical protein
MTDTLTSAWNVTGFLQVLFEAATSPSWQHTSLQRRLDRRDLRYGGGFHGRCCWHLGGATLQRRDREIQKRSEVPFLAPLNGAFAVVVGLAQIVFAFRLRDRSR